MLKNTLVIRHRRENLKKCSLRGLENREDFQFFTYPQDTLPNLGNCIVLSLNAPPLEKSDGDRPLLLIDATWKLAEKMYKHLKPLTNPALYRSLPSHFRTAYPRRQEDCPNKDQGLASIEALYLAYCLLGKDPQGLLDHYHWKEQFLQAPHNFIH